MSRLRAIQRREPRGRAEPPSRLELETYGLRNRCSTTELRRRVKERRGNLLFRVEESRQTCAANRASGARQCQRCRPSRRCGRRRVEVAVAAPRRRCSSPSLLLAVAAPRRRCSSPSLLLAASSFPHAEVPLHASHAHRAHSDAVARLGDGDHVCARGFSSQDHGPILLLGRLTPSALLACARRPPKIAFRLS